jgi:hypothetical protein
MEIWSSAFKIIKNLWLSRMDKLRTVPLKSKIGLSLYGKIGILVESNPEENRFVLQIPTYPDDPYRTAWEMRLDEERQTLVLVKENMEKVVKDPEPEKTTVTFLN